MILLNEIYLSKKKMLRARFPFYDIDLFSIDTEKYEIKNIVKEKEFDSARNAHTPDDDFLSGDRPRYTDFRSCLITSAFLPFSNFIIC